jgi:hypothetical protein
MIRHNASPQPCEVIVTTEPTGAEVVHLVIWTDGKTQRLILTPQEAKAVAACLVKTAEEA